VLVRRLVSPWYAVLSVVLFLAYRIWCFPHWQIYSYSTTCLLMLLVAMIVLLRFFESGSRRMLALAGLCFGLAVFAKQDYGAAGLFALSLALFAYAAATPRDERAGVVTLYTCFIAPAALVGLATVLHFVWQGMFAEFIQLTVLNHFVGIQSYEYMSFPPLLPIFDQDPALRTEVGVTGYMPAIMYTADWDGVRASAFFKQTFLYDATLKAFYYGPYVLLAAGGIRLVSLRRRLADPDQRPLQLRELLLWALGVGLIGLVSLNKPQDYLHLAVLYWPLIVLSVVYAHALLSGRRRRTLISAAVLVLPAVAGLAYTGELVWRFHQIHSSRLELPRGGIKVLPSEARMLEDVVGYIHEESAPGDPVAVMPYFPVVQFLADRRGPHRSSYIIWPFPEFPDRDDQIIAAMEETGTNLLVYNFTQFHSFPPVREYAPGLFEYLVENFEIDRVFTYDFWGYKLAGAVRRSEPHDGIDLLADEGRGSALYIETGLGPPRAIAPSERPRYFELTSWPMRPVMALRPSARGARTVLTVPLDVPDASSLRTAVGVNPLHWFDFPKSWVRFHVAVVDGDETTRVFTRELDPTMEFSDRGWFEVEIPLESWAGRRVRLEFSTECERLQGQTLLMGGWGRPRIVPSPSPSAELALGPAPSAVADSEAP